MKVKTSLITVVVGATLVLGVPAAWGKAQPVSSASPDAVERAVLARELSNRSSSVALRDAFERAVVTTQTHSGSLDRSVGLNRQHGLGEFAGTPRDAFERAAEGAARSVSGTGDRSIGLNLQYGLGDFASAPMSDVHVRVASAGEPISTPTVGTGRDLEWPQMGIGFVVGLLLALGLGLAMRSTRIRPLAH